MIATTEGRFQAKRLDTLDRTGPGDIFEHYRAPQGGEGCLEGEGWSHFEEHGTHIMRHGG